MYPTPVDGEGWFSYVRMLASKNELSGPRQLAKIYGLTTADLRSRPIHEQVKLMGVSTDVKFQKYVGREAEILNAFDRVCVHCLREGAVRLPSKWTQPLTLACDKHDIYLTDTCERCRQPLSIARRASRSCQCGADIGTFSVRAAGTEALNIASEFLDDADRLEAGTFAPVLEEAYRVASRLRVVSWHFGLHGLPSMSQTWPTVDELDTSLIWLADWPNEFVRRARIYVGAASSGSDRQCRIMHLRGKASASFSEVVIPLLSEQVLAPLARIDDELHRLIAKAAKLRDERGEDFRKRVRLIELRSGADMSLEQKKATVREFIRAGRMRSTPELRLMYGGGKAMWTRMCSSGVLTPDIAHYQHVMRGARSWHDRKVKDVFTILGEACKTFRWPRGTATSELTKFMAGRLYYPWSPFKVKLEAIQRGEVLIRRKPKAPALSFESYEVDRRSSLAWKYRLGRLTTGSRSRDRCF